MDIVHAICRLSFVTLLLTGSARGDERPLPHMVSTKGLERLLPGASFLARARDGSSGVLTFGLDRRVTFGSDVGLFKLSETGYCSRWRSMGYKTRCFTLSVLRGHRKYQVWTVYGDPVDTLVLLPSRHPSPAKVSAPPLPRPRVDRGSDPDMR